MIDDIIVYFIFLGGGISLLASFGQAIVTRTSIRNHNLKFLFLTLGILLFQYISIFTGLSNIHHWILYYHMTLLWLQAPLLYLAYYFLVNSEESIEISILKIFIPAIIVFVIESGFIVAQVTGFIKEMFIHLNNDNHPWLLVKRLLIIAAALQIVIYLTIFFFQILSVLNLKKRNAIMIITGLYSFSSLIAAAFMITAYITSSFEYLKITALITSAGLIFIYPLGQRYPRFFQNLQDEVKKREYTKNLLSSVDLDIVLDEMTDLMKESRLYSNENLTLKELAVKLSLTPHQLSQLLNDKLNTNFSTYINRYRISEAKHILLQEPDRTVLSIAFDVGFNNKSSFYEAFSKFTGKSPQRYRKEKIRL